MERVGSDLERRAFLKKLLMLGAVGTAHASLLTRQVLAMGEGGQLLEGVRKVQGSVLINGAPAAVNALVFPGDVITTGSASLGVFVVGKDAFLVRENSRVELIGERAGQEPGATKLVRTVKVAAGKVLSVLGRGEKRIETTNAVAGVRGSACYVESETEVSYICLCYGEAELSSLANPSAREVVVTKHHENPRYILPKCVGKPFLKAPAINHTDEELVMLEALVGRKPPFGASSGFPSSAY